MTCLVACTAILAQIEEQVVTDGVAIFEGLLIVVVLFAMSFVGKAIVTKEDRNWLPTMICGRRIAKMIGGSAASGWSRCSMGPATRTATTCGVGSSPTYGEACVVPVSRPRGAGHGLHRGRDRVHVRPLHADHPRRVRHVRDASRSSASCSFLPGSPSLVRPVSAQDVRTGRVLRPSLLFWPSSIGKDALMVFFLGLASYGASRLLKFYQFSSRAS